MDTGLFNSIIGIVFLLLYFYQAVYIFAVLFHRKDEKRGPVPLARFRVLICARNEKDVIGRLIESIKRQNYPEELVDIFVMADNCTDNTAQIAADSGAIVYTRYDDKKKGKGYALDTLLKNILRDCPDRYDAYMVFDADNILAPDYISQMNRTFSEGNDIITSYRNSTNYDRSWVSQGYALWFLRESVYLNEARSILGTGCSVSGTGFLFSDRILSENRGWPYYTLTEDVQFSMDMAARGEKIAFCKNAEFFDEQPVNMSQSVKQRLRWGRGFFQALAVNMNGLVKGVIKGNFTCYDMIAACAAPFFISTRSLIFNVSARAVTLLTTGSIISVLMPALRSLATSYIGLFFIGVLTTVSEWEHIKTDTFHKVCYLFTFPLFVFTYLPITIASLVVKPEWAPIVHTGSVGREKAKGQKSAQPGN